MSRETFRDYCRPIIGEVIERVGRDDMRALRKALREAFPLHGRDCHPYFVWQDEIRNQLKIKPKHVPDPQQPELF